MMMMTTKRDNNKYVLRELEEQDKDILFEWANDKKVRENAFSQTPISYEEHTRWFNNVINDNKILVYVLLENNIPVGQCRLNIDDKGLAEVDYSIATSHRGSGLGKLLISLVISEVKTNHREIKALIGKVKPGNEVSSKCFISNGFINTYQVYEMEIPEEEGK